MAENSVKTVHHAKLEQKRSLDVPFSTDTNSTINEYLKGNWNGSNWGTELIALANQVVVLPNPYDDYNIYPNIKYLTVGIRPVDEDTTGGLPPKHRSTDARLFTMIPWIYKAIINDITSPGDLAKYRLRVAVTGTDVALANTTPAVVLKAGNVYYFGRVLDTNAVVPEIYNIEIDDGVVVNSVAAPLTSNDLINISPVDVDNINTNMVNGYHRAVQSIISIDLTATDVSELVSTVTHLFGNSTNAAITEFGIVSAYDYTIVGPPSGKELSCAQVVNYIGTNIPLQGLPSAVNLTFALTASMPHPDTI